MHLSIFHADFHSTPPCLQVEFAPSPAQNAYYSTSYEVVGFGDARMMVKRAGVYVRVLHSGMLVRFSLVEMLQVTNRAKRENEYGIVVNIDTRRRREQMSME